MSLVRSPRVKEFDDVRAAARSVAERIVTAIEWNPSIVLGLPTGRTPIAMYDELVKLSAARGTDWSSVTTFNLDEFIGLPPAHPGSYRQFMQQHLFGEVNMSPARINFLDGMAQIPSASVRATRPRSPPPDGIDIQILGIGTNGHIGFNEPGRELQSRTHRVTLRPETRRSNATLFGGDMRERAGRGAVDGNGDDSSGAQRHPAGERAQKGDVRRARRQRSADDAICRRRSCSCTTTSTSSWMRPPRAS